MTALAVKVFASVVAFALLALGNQLKENSKADDPPCFFNPLCICSKAYPDLGRVACKNVPMLTIPRQINESKLFTLHLHNNGLRYIEPQSFKETGLFRIKISRNFLTEITEETFTGLERSLWELNLQHNKFKKVPNQSFRYLQKLKLLDLSDNEITSIGAEDWMGLEDSLKTLDLSGNKLSALGPRTFSALDQLETLDLSRNVLFELDEFTFKDGPFYLRELDLADNLLVNIPYQELSELRELRYLDLSFNLITDVQDVNFDRNKKKLPNLVVDVLKLDYNQIRYLPAESFKSFPRLNTTSLNGNPIGYIEKNAFQSCKIQELFLKDCEISELSIEAFSGLENFLEVLDLEGNNLTSLPLYFFKEFDGLRSLNLKDNFLKEIDSDKMFDVFPTSLQHLDLCGQKNFPFNFHHLEKFHDLRSLTLSLLPQTSLSSADIPESLTALEELKIFNGNIETLKNHAFKNVRGLRRLDLSENSIAAIESDAFAEVGHSLVHLSLANGLSPLLTQVPFDIFQDLTSLEQLDLSNNRLKNLPSKFFDSMKRLKVAQIQDNFIEFIPKRAFQKHIHSELSDIQFSFNQLTSIESQTFVGLDKLENLWLNDNKISTVEKRAFMDLDKLKFLYLRGNEIKFLKQEAFQDLPELEKLDLAYNRLKMFNYDCLEQVGTLSSFTLNISHNEIERLITNISVPDYPSFAVMHVNIKALDLSCNNVTVISPRFFRPLESSITHLYLSHNRLRNLSKDVFGNMMHLQWLDLSFNNLTELAYDSFENTKNIQVLFLTNNDIQEIPKHLFKGFHRLKVLKLENNHLRSLVENLFGDAVIQKLDVSGNRLTKVPIASFDKDSAAVLAELDLSQNEIVTLPSADEFYAFRNLYWLNLSKNLIIRIEDGMFSYLGRLHVLDLSHNSELFLNPKGQTFHGLGDTLEDLILKNLSLNEIPALRLNSLQSLDVSDNYIVNIPFEFSHNMSYLQRIELGGNKMVSIPPAINALTKLQYLGISRNPIRSISLQQSYNLREVDLRNVSTQALEKGALGKLPLLTTLKLSINQKFQDLNLPRLLKDHYGLNHLYIEVLESDGSSLGDEISGSFSPKLRYLTLDGHGLKTIPKNLLQAVKSSRLALTLFNTSVQKIPEGFFQHAEKIRNLTLDVRSNPLRTLPNPNTGDYPNTPKKMFLTDLDILDNNWVCDCSIGWMEMWERKRRQFLCEDGLEECFLVSENLRTAVCSNRKPKTLIQVFKEELECGWNSSESLNNSKLLKVLLLLLLLTG